VRDASIRGIAEWDAETTVDEALARALIIEQFPHLAVGSLRLIGEGWDNTVWATGDGVAFRFPRRRIAIPGVEREIALLPELAPQLPVAIPDAAFAGAPTERFPWPWFGSRLITGREIVHSDLDDDQMGALAGDLGEFLRCLHGVDLAWPERLEIDPMGRGDMARRVPQARRALAAVAPIWRAPDRARHILDDAEAIPRSQATVLVHGDLHARQLLVDDAGRLTGVIDWGDVCRADPSVDLSLYWSLFPPAARTTFLAAYGDVPESGLMRARVLALFLCATLAVYARSESMTGLEREAVGGLQRALID
jgi:aminoglycoside phosphotransferase (APT) family kinase protein